MQKVHTCLLSPDAHYCQLSPITCHPTPLAYHCHHYLPLSPWLSPSTITVTATNNLHYCLSPSPSTVTVTCHRRCHHLPLLSPLLSNPITCHHYHYYCDCPPSPVMVTCYCHWSLVLVTMTVHYQHDPSSLTITCHKAVLNYALAHAVTPSQLSTSTFSQLSSLIFLELCNENCSKILVIFIQ